MDKVKSFDADERIPNHDGRGIVGKVVRVRSGILDVGGGGQLLSCLPAVRRKAGIAGVTRFRTKEG